MGRARPSATTGQCEMRRESMFFLRNSQSLQRLVDGFCHLRKWRSAFNSHPENPSRFCGRKKPVAAKAHFDRAKAETGESPLDLFHSLRRLFANKFQGNVQRFRSDPARVRREATHSFDEALNPLSDGVVNIESNKNAHEKSPLQFASHQRRTATTDQIASTTPKGHAPCRNP